MLFTENACENERIGSCRGVHWAHPLDLPMHFANKTTSDDIIKLDSGKQNEPHPLCFFVSVVGSFDLS